MTNVLTEHTAPWRRVLVRNGWTLGVWLLQFVSTTTLWWLYVVVLVFLAYRMAFPPRQDDSAAPQISDGTRARAGAASAGIGVFAGLLGVGPGFLLMPALVLFGYTARLAAATNSVIVTLPSFSAFATHLSDARFDWLDDTRAQRPEWIARFLDMKTVWHPIGV